MAVMVWCVRHFCRTYISNDTCIYISEINMHEWGRDTEEWDKNRTAAMPGTQKEIETEKEQKMRNIYIYLCEFYRSKWYNSRYILLYAPSAHGYGWVWVFVRVCVYPFVSKHSQTYIPFIFVDQIYCYVYCTHIFFVSAHKYKWYRILEMMLTV